MVCLGLLNEHEDVAVRIGKVSFEGISPARTPRWMDNGSTMRFDTLAITIDITCGESKLRRVMAFGRVLGAHPLKQHQIGLARPRFDGQPAIVWIGWIRHVSGNFEVERIPVEVESSVTIGDEDRDAV